MGSHNKIPECFEQNVPTYLGTHGCIFLLCSVLGRSVEPAPPVGEEKEELEDKEKGEEEEDTLDVATHSLGAEGNFMPFSG